MDTFTVIKTGGKQYKVKKGDTLKIEKLAQDMGKLIEFDKVLLVSDGTEKGTKIGQPYIEGAKVTAEILEQGRAKKVTIIKYKRKTRYRRKRGHRQPFTKVKIKDISI